KSLYSLVKIERYNNKWQQLIFYNFRFSGCLKIIDFLPVSQINLNNLKITQKVADPNFGAPGLSLNDLLLKGEVKGRHIFEIMTRFRPHKYAFTIDIQMMFRQILIDPAQRDLLRIKWKTGDYEESDIYRLNTVTYGTASAPLLAIRTLKQLAMDEASRFPLASKVALQDVYKDGIVPGGTQNKSIHSYRFLRETHAFRIRRCFGVRIRSRSVHAQFKEDSTTTTKLISSKSRVAPIKVISIPRLELSACLLLAQLEEKVRLPLQVHLAKVILLTDSTIAIAWMNTPANQLKTFVVNRVSKIQTLTENFEWKHMPSA
ncbi:DUF1758 domain-containing protein, partial [Trichonephila clavipes]